MATVIDLFSRAAHTPPPGNLMRATRERLGLAREDFAGVLTQQLNLSGVDRIRPGMVAEWEDSTEMPGDVEEACRALLVADPAALQPASPDNDELFRVLGMTWGTSPTEVVKAVGGLFAADLRRRDAITSLATVAMAEPLSHWLLSTPDRDVARIGSRQVGQADIAAVWSMCTAFADADRRLGGGHARHALICYADEVVTPLLAGRYTDATGRKLFAAAARVCDVAGFMCFDSDHQGLGQQYFAAALRMAKVSGDLALGAHILTDMSMQAQHLRNPHESVGFAEASVAAGQKSGSASALARCEAVHARALALAGDARGSDHALNQAEKALERADPAGEPFWLAFFTREQLSAESVYAASELHRSSLVQRHAAGVLPADGMQRRHVLTTVTLSASYLPPEGGPLTPGADVEQACGVLRTALPLLGSQTSARALGLLSAVRRRLAPYSHVSCVQDLEREIRQRMIGAVS